MVAISLIDAFKQVFKDKNFMPTYTVLVILSFCCGLLFFATLAKNTPLIFPSIILAICALCLSEGFHLQYFKSLVTTQDKNMPNFKDVGCYAMTGIKFLAATTILCLTILPLTIFSTIFVLLFSVISKPAMHLALLFSTFIFLIIEIFILICIPAFIYVFTDTDEDVVSFLFIKKLCGYFSCNYFSALFLIAFISALNGVISVATTVNIKYALLYIIPLMITPIIRLGADNILAQAYCANKNSEKGSVGRMIFYLFSAFVIMFILFYFAAKTGYNRF